MRVTILSIALTLLASSAPIAQEAGGYTCESIVANAERSQADMMVASATYIHGKFMGQPCVEIDYDRAFELARMAGVDPQAYVRIMRERAANGSRAAAAALERLVP